MNSDLNTIVECVFDISFESKAVAENFLTIISKIDDFEEITKLPLHQIPEAIRKNDPNLKGQPLYEIRSKTNPDYRIMLGDHTVGIAVNKYTRWSNSFFPQIKKLYTALFESKKITQINRLGLRYVDFLENENIFKTGKIKVNIDQSAAEDKKMFLRVEDSKDDVFYVKVATNKTQYANSIKIGSIIDIVTSMDNKNLILDDSFNDENFFTDADKLHTVNKEKFKEVISDELARQYNL